MSGAFTVYRFDEPASPDVVYLEHTTSDLYVESPEQVERYNSAFDRLRTAAHAAPSVDRIPEVAGRRADFDELNKLCTRSLLRRRRRRPS